MKDFDAWFCQQGTEQEEQDELVRLTCNGCGKTETVDRKALENGDAWAMNYDDDTGLCGGSDRCVP